MGFMIQKGRPALSASSGVLSSLTGSGKKKKEKKEEEEKNCLEGYGISLDVKIDRLDKLIFKYALQRMLKERMMKRDYV